MNQFSRNLIVWAVIILGTMMLFNLFQQPQSAGRQDVSYSELLERVENGQISKVTIQGQELTVTMNDGQMFNSFVPRDEKLVPLLLEKGIDIKAEPQESQPWYAALLVTVVPLLLMAAAFWYIFSRQMNSSGSKAFSFGHSKAKLLNQNDKKRVTFTDVAGVDEAKDELQEVVEFLSNPQKFTRLGGRIPKGCLLVGPPGTGKTLLAKAVAGEAGVPFFSISGSDFVEMFVGVGASRVRDLFAQGKKNAPCIIFIDEIDAVGRKRGAGLGGGNDEREQTLNQMLVEMDGFEANEGVILIAATNRPDVLDPALLRPGRFDRQVVVPTPDRAGRKQILRIHSRKTPLARDVDLSVIAGGTPGFSGADLENLVNEAALQAARDSRDEVSMHDFEYAKDKIIMGRERRSLILSEQEKRVTAYHEAGHALSARLLPGTDPVHKVSIVPRGQALGITMQLPEEDRHGYSMDYLKKSLVILFGGRTAEEIIFEDITTGASNDIERATTMARRMVCEWGMSSAVGTIAIGESGQEVFIGREWVQNKNYSESTARLVDSEVRRILEEAHSHCTQLLRDNLDALHRIAEALIARESISGSDLDLLIKGEPLPPLEDDGPAKSEKDSSSGPQGGQTAAPAPAPEKDRDGEESGPVQDNVFGDFTFEPVDAADQSAQDKPRSPSSNEGGDRP